MTLNFMFDVRWCIFVMHVVILHRRIGRVGVEIFAAEGCYEQELVIQSFIGLPHYESRGIF